MGAPAVRVPAGEGACEPPAPSRGARLATSSVRPSPPPFPRWWWWVWGGSPRSPWGGGRRASRGDGGSGPAAFPRPGARRTSLPGMEALPVGPRFSSPGRRGGSRAGSGPSRLPPRRRRAQLARLIVCGRSCLGEGTELAVCYRGVIWVLQL